MHLIKNDVVEIAEKTVSVFCQLYNIAPADLYDIERHQQQFSGQELRDYSHALDFGAAGWIAKQAQTFLFDAEQILQFLRAVDRRLAPGDYAAPFAFMCIQFSEGIDEKLFTTGLRSSGSIEESDEILGLFIAVPTDDNPTHQFLNVVAWYKSTSINRIQVSVAGDGTIEYRPLDDSILDRAEQLYQDKQRLANLAMLCLAYLATPGVMTEKVSAPVAVNAKRAKKGKRPLEDYYTVTWSADKVHYTGGAGQATDRHVSFRFDVAGHFRRLADGRMIWVRPHQRGLEHEVYRPKVYRVE